MQPTPDELAELAAWQEEQLAQAEAEGAMDSPSPALSRFRRHAWVSTSWGKGRGKRKRPTEVELVNDTYSPDQPPRWTSSHKLPYDTLATETYGDDTYMDGLELEARLMKEIHDA